LRDVVGLVGLVTAVGCPLPGSQFGSHSPGTRVYLPRLPRYRGWLPVTASCAVVTYTPLLVGSTVLTHLPRCITVIWTLVDLLPLPGYWLVLIWLPRSPLRFPCRFTTGHRLTHYLCGSPLATLYPILFRPVVTLPVYCLLLQAHSLRWDPFGLVTHTFLPRTVVIAPLPLVGYLYPSYPHRADILVAVYVVIWLTPHGWLLGCYPLPRIH